MYTTKDLYFASILHSKGYKLYTTEKIGKTTYFTFTVPKNELDLLLSEWKYETLMVEPKKLFESMKKLKQLIYETENGEWVFNTNNKHSFPTGTAEKDINKPIVHHEDALDALTQ